MASAVDKMKPLVDMYKCFQMAQDPMAMLSNMAMNNTDLGKVYSMIQGANGNPQEAFMAKARSMGMTDKQIEDGLLQMRQKLGL